MKATILKKELSCKEIFIDKGWDVWWEHGKWIKSVDGCFRHVWSYRGNLGGVIFWMLWNVVSEIHSFPCNLI